MPDAVVEWKKYCRGQVKKAFYAYKPFPNIDILEGHKNGFAANNSKNQQHIT